MGGTVMLSPQNMAKPHYNAGSIVGGSGTPVLVDSVDENTDDTTSTSLADIASIPATLSISRHREACPIK